MANFFCRSRPTTNWAAATAYALGDRRKATAAALGIHFEVTTAGTSHATTEPTWNTTVGGTTADGTVTWTTRGSAADRVASTAYVLGDRVVATAAESAAEQSLVYECTTAGTSGAGATIAFSTTVGNTTTDNTVVWTTRACTTWDNAHIRLDKLVANSSSTIAAGDTVYVGDGHLQTGAVAITITPQAGTRVNPLKILCVNDTGDPSSPTTLATTAVLETTGGVAIAWSAAKAYVYGIIHNCGTGASAADLGIGDSTSLLTFEGCAFKLLTTSATSDISLNSSGSSSLKWINCTVQFSDAAQGILMESCDFEWIGGSLVLGTAPTVLFESYSISTSTVRLHGVDLANLSTAIFNAAILAPTIDLYNCKLHASVVLVTGTNSGIGGRIRMINCDSGATNTNVQYELGEGALTDELTIKRTGGATDGTTAFAWKIVTRATTPRFEFPFISLPIAQWNNTTGASKTLTVEIVNDGLTLTDGEVWLEAGYLGTAGFPIASFIDDAKADILAAAANQASSAVTWTTTGLTSPIKQKLEVTFTPQLKGPVIARVCVARPSLTLYVDPIATIT